MTKGAGLECGIFLHSYFRLDVVVCSGKSFGGVVPVILLDQRFGTDLVFFRRDFGVIGSARSQKESNRIPRLTANCGCLMNRVRAFPSAVASGSRMFSRSKMASLCLNSP